MILVTSCAVLCFRMQAALQLVKRAPKPFGIASEQSSQQAWTLVCHSHLQAELSSCHTLPSNKHSDVCICKLGAAMRD